MPDKEDCMKRSSVAITACKTYDRQELYAAIGKAFEAAGLTDVSDKRILLKPNILSDAVPEKNITTHPEVLRAVIRYLVSKGAASILVGDSPGIQGSFFVPKNSKIAEVCEQEHVPWIDFAKDPVSTVIPFTLGRRLPLPKILDSVDLIISVAKMKTHQLMYMTGSVKNLFGMVPGLHKSPCHMMYPTREAFARLIAGLYVAVKPSFAILDAVVSMEGAGPASGLPHHTGLIMASSDCTALDVAQSIVMGYDPMTIPITKELHERRLTAWRKPTDIEYPLLHANDLIIEDYQRIKIQRKTRMLSALIGPVFTKFIKLRHQRKEPKPIFDRTLCIGCNRCVKICPGKALVLDEQHKIVVDYRSCIRCYCCHEVCPAHAITIEQKESE